MAVEWFCRIMGSEVGPLSQDQLIDMVRSHQLNAEDLVRRNSSPWVAAFEVKGLFEAAAKPPRKKPQPKQEEPASTVEQEKKTYEAARERLASTFREPNGQKAASASWDAGDKHDWFCIASGEKRGPMSFNELKGLASSGALRGKDRVWRGSAPKWKKADDVEGLLQQ